MKMRTQVIVPMADMLIKYCMFPYHAVLKSASLPEKGEIDEVLVFDRIGDG